MTRNEELAAAQDACVEAMKRIAAVEGVNVHGSVRITVDITTYAHAGFSTPEGEAVREKIYDAEAQIMDAYPGVLFDFKVG
jgi:hypothetical protein